MVNNKYFNERKSLLSELRNYFNETEGVSLHISHPLTDGFKRFIRKKGPQKNFWLRKLQIWKERNGEKARDKGLTQLAISAWLEYGTERFGLPKQLFIDDVKEALTINEFDLLTSTLKDEVEMFAQSELKEVLMSSPTPKLVIPVFRAPEEIRQECVVLEHELRAAEERLKTLLESSE